MPIRSLQLSSTEVPVSREDTRLGHRKGRVTSHVNAVSGEDGGLDELVPGDRASDGLSLTELLKQERAVGSGDLDSNIIRNVIKGGGRLASALSSHAHGQDEEDVGGVVDAGKLVAAPEARYTAMEQRKRDMAQAVQAARSTDAALARCPYCMDSPEFLAKHAHKVVAVGEYAYVCTPPHGPRTPGHLLIVPRDHTPSMTGVGEETYAEVNKFKAALCAMFRARGGGAGGGGQGGTVGGEAEDGIFLETCLGLSGGELGGAAGLSGVAKRRHTIIDVIPLETGLAFDAPLFFRKAIQDHIGSGEAERDEWGTNRGIVDTAGKGLKRSVPPGFSYFHVSWQGGGLVHPIEVDASFPPSFGLDVGAGMAGGDPARFGRREARAGRTRETEAAEAAALRAEFEAVNFTGGGGATQQGGGR